MSLLVKIFTGVLLTQAAVWPLVGPKTAEVAELKSTIHDWNVPTQDAKPYATVATPDGSIWFTEESANKIGCLNPQTGELKEYPLTEDKSAGPRGIAANHDGSIWYSASSAGFIGRLEPKTGKVTIFRMPDPKAKDPDSLAFDSNGTLWFTLPTSNMVGKLDPASGEINLKAIPTQNARPNGILLLKRSLLAFSETGASKIGFLSPDTFAIQEFPLSPGSRSRHLALAADENSLYFTDFVSGNLGKLDISIGALVMFPSPGGPDSNPYGLTITPDGMVWYSETGNQPNKIIRFNPASSTFASAPIPFATGSIHNMTAIPDSRVYFTSAGVNKIGVIEASK